MKIPKGPLSHCPEPGVRVVEKCECDSTFLLQQRPLQLEGVSRIFRSCSGKRAPRWAKVDGGEPSTRGLWEQPCLPSPLPFHFSATVGAWGSPGYPSSVLSSPCHSMKSPFPSQGSDQCHFLQEAYRDFFPYGNWPLSLMVTPEPWMTLHACFPGTT